MKRVLTGLAFALAAAACEKTPTEYAGGTVFVINVVEDETFRILLQDSARVARARELIASGDSLVVHGVLKRGTGGFNAGFSWHLEPGTVTFVDTAMELCDGRPSYVESELDYYLASVKYYCPWGAKVVAEE